MTAPDPDTDTLTVAEVAAKLKCGAKHVLRLIKSGRLASVPWGFGIKRRRRRVTRAELQRFLSTPETPDRPPAIVPRRKGKLPPVPQYF